MDDADWAATTFEGCRRRHHREFYALPFRQKLEILEQHAEVAAFFVAGRAARSLPTSGPSAARLRGSSGAPDPVFADGLQPEDDETTG